MATVEQRLASVELQLGRLIRMGALLDTLAARVNDRLDRQNEVLEAILKELRGESDAWSSPWKSDPEEDGD